MASNTTPELEAMRSQWTELYSKTLPALARARDPAQSRWPVALDHCFARIILDNTVGRGALQWDNVIKKPAVRNMDEAQLKEAISLGEKIKAGEANLVELDQQSLRARGKGEKKYKTLRKDVKTGTTLTTTPAVKHSRSDSKDDKEDGAKREREEEDNDGDDDDANPRPPKQRRRSPIPIKKQGILPFASNPSKADANPNPNPNLPVLLSKISSHPTLTPFRKRLYSTLLSVPAGHFTTYAAMAASLNSAARAVGNGMRNNPFAPEVPCHRVLAADGSIGGFGGDWGVDGKHADKKRELLRGEGVRFDSKGKVKGRGWDGLRDMREVVEMERAG